MDELLEGFWCADMPEVIKDLVPEARIECSMFRPRPRTDQQASNISLWLLTMLPTSYLGRDSVSNTNMTLPIEALYSLSSPFVHLAA